MDVRLELSLRCATVSSVSAPSRAVSRAKSTGPYHKEMIFEDRIGGTERLKCDYTRLQCKLLSTLFLSTLVLGERVFKKPLIRNR
jgi:hypothetical protein